MFCVRGVERRDKIQRIQRNPLMPQHDGGSIVAQCSAKHGNNSIITHSIHKVKGFVMHAHTCSDDIMLRPTGAGQRKSFY